MSRAHLVRRWVVAFWRKAYEDNVTGLSGMVAYNLLLSIFPFALVALFVGGRLLRSEDLQVSVLEDLKRIFPTAAESTLSEGVRRLRETSTTVGLAAIAASIWFGASFWGALDTAFCRIYHRPCRPWVQQKLFAIGMLGIVLLFVAATVAVPAIQSLLASGAKDLPLGLSEVRAVAYYVSLALGVAALFVALCATYRLVPKGSVPWRAVWPGALGATIAMAIVDLGFPLYLDNISTLRVGTTAVFVLIALVWFYVLALIVLAGAVVNDLRWEHSSRDSAEPPEPYPVDMPDPTTEGMRLDQIEKAREERRRAEDATEPSAEQAHGRRADRADYLREKLAERARAEDEAAAADDED